MPYDHRQSAQRIIAGIRAAGFPQDNDRQAMHVVAETGEFLNAYLKWAGQHRTNGSETKVQSELCDVVLAAFITAEEFKWTDFDCMIEHRAIEILERGWERKE